MTSSTSSTLTPTRSATARATARCSWPVRSTEAPESVRTYSISGAASRLFTGTEAAPATWAAR